MMTANTHAPLFDDPLADEPHMVCAVCDQSDFTQLDWYFHEHPVRFHLRVACVYCGATNHLEVGLLSGRIIVHQRSSYVSEL